VSVCVCVCVSTDMLLHSTGALGNMQLPLPSHCPVCQQDEASHCETDTCANNVWPFTRLNLMMEVKKISEMLVYSSTLRQLIPWTDFGTFIHHESFKNLILWDHLHVSALNGFHYGIWGCTSELDMQLVTPIWNYSFQCFLLHLIKTVFQIDFKMVNT
jgi:hypothetical protein